MKNIVFALLLCAGFACASAQEVYTSSGKPGYHKKTKREKGFDPSKLVLGGGLDAGYSNGFAIAGISPIVGYRFFNNFTAGVGLGYLYVQFPDFELNGKNYYDKENIIYPSLWARYTIYRGLYATGSYEYDIIKLSQPAFDVNNPSNIINKTASINAQCLFAGVGLRQPLGGRVSFFIEVLHEFLQQKNSPYLTDDVGPLIFRAGIAAGL